VGTSGKGEVEHGGSIFLFMYENRAMKPVEIVLRRGKRL
jgi:hypothetical protein